MVLSEDSISANKKPKLPLFNQMNSSLYIIKKLIIYRLT